jgi:hypothetical protein
MTNQSAAAAADVAKVARAEAGILTELVRERVLAPGSQIAWGSFKPPVAVLADGRLVVAGAVVGSLIEAEQRLAASIGNPNWGRRCVRLGDWQALRGDGSRPSLESLDQVLVAARRVGLAAGDDRPLAVTRPRPAWTALAAGLGPLRDATFDQLCAYREDRAWGMPAVGALEALKKLVEVSLERDRNATAVTIVRKRAWWWENLCLARPATTEFSHESWGLTVRRDWGEYERDLRAALGLIR